MQGNVDYAVDMFAQCVIGDPGNAVFLQKLLESLKRKFGGKKAGSLTSFFAAGSRAGLKKLASSAQWRDIIKQGVEIIKGNLSDHVALLAMADACGNLMFFDTQAFYLRAALDASPTDPEVNKQCAKFAASQGNFDQATLTRRSSAGGGSAGQRASPRRPKRPSPNCRSTRRSPRARE